MKKVIFIILIASLLISGCQLDGGRIETSESFIDYVSDTANSDMTSSSIDVEPSEPSVEKETSVSEVAVETSLPDIIDFVPMDLNYDFEDIMNTCNDYVGLDISQYSGDVINTIDVNDHHILYIPDYSEHLEGLIEISPEGVADELPEYEYHILRTLTVDGVHIYEFDDAYWAGVSYSIFVDNAVSSNFETIDSSYSEGYCFTYDSSNPQLRMFAVRCCFGSFIMSYDYSVTAGHTDNYEKYIDLCSLFGFPTSDQITSIVLHN